MDRVTPQVVATMEGVGYTQFASLAQLVRSLACHARGQGFESPTRRQYSLIAQSVERRTVNPQVGGSNPPRGASRRTRSIGDFSRL